MALLTDALNRLREQPEREGADPVSAGIRAAGIRFAAIGGRLETRWEDALQQLNACIRPLAGSAPVLCEGGVYYGSWLESTATINAELLSRFAPDVTRSTLLQLAKHQRPDGLIPYKVTDDGPAFSQIQLVSPLARTVWNHYRQTGDRKLLTTMFAAMVRYDAWLARHRDTRGTGAVEAFCTFDTGHDLSPRFWFVADRCFQGDATRFDPASPVLPYIAPDLTANVACQRQYLAVIAEELGEDAAVWRDRAAASLEALFDECFDPADGTFYDRDASGAPVRIASDVLLRVLACEVGDDAFFTAALERYLMHTGKFLAHYGFTSIAMDDPRFDHDSTRNSWGGPSNFLSLIRAPHAFEHHGRVAELAVASMPVLSALTIADRFPQCLDPWSGTAGFTEQYSPSILWLLDSVERYFGVLERPDGELWFSGLSPTRLEHGAAPDAVAYSRTLGGTRYELACDDERAEVHVEGSVWLRFPRGWRVIVRGDAVVAVVGLAGAPVSGVLWVGERSLTLTLAPNERVHISSLAETHRTAVGFVLPHG